MAVEITEVRIKLMSEGNDKLRAFCSVTIDNDFVVRDLKVIEGSRGPFVAMPSRKLTERCPRCKGKNHHRAAYCNDCGTRLFQRHLEDGTGRSDTARLKLHADIAHPINSRCRELVQARILEEYRAELERAKDPNYHPADLDVFDEDYLTEETGELVVLGEDGRPVDAPGSLRDGPSLHAGGLESPSELEPPREADGAVIPNHPARIPNHPARIPNHPARTPNHPARFSHDSARASHDSARHPHDSARASHDQRRRQGSPPDGPRRPGDWRSGVPSRGGLRDRAPAGRGQSGGDRRGYGRQEGHGGRPHRGDRAGADDSARAPHDSARAPHDSARAPHDSARAPHDSARYAPREGLQEPKKVTREVESEPEDNFGVGLFS